MPYDHSARITGRDRVAIMSLRRYPLKDTLPISRIMKKLLKRSMARWLRREAKRDPENAPKGRRFKGWYW
jgi:hypothetical protein